MRYMDRIGIWEGKEEELQEKLKDIEDKKKGLQLEWEVEKEERIIFLNMEKRRMKENGKVKQNGTRRNAMQVSCVKWHR